MTNHILVINYMFWVRQLVSMGWYGCCRLNSNIWKIQACFIFEAQLPVTRLHIPIWDGGIYCLKKEQPATQTRDLGDPSQQYIINENPTLYCKDPSTYGFRRITTLIKISPVYLTTTKDTMVFFEHSSQRPKPHYSKSCLISLHHLSSNGFFF